MYRRAYVLLVGVAAVMGLLAWLTSWKIGRPLVDPEGFLGPAWVRLPLMVFGAFLLDVLPRTLWLSKMDPRKWPGLVRDRVRDHWTKDRIVLVGVGLICFYVTYVSYRNLKSFLPFVMGPGKYDRQLRELDSWIFFGHDPGPLVQDLFGAGVTAHVLSAIYLWFLPLVPLALAAWLVWSRNISFGYWFVTSQVLAWTLGTASYYMLPTVGPGFQYPWLYDKLPYTGAEQLMESLSSSRHVVLHSDITDAVNSVAGFASLHCAITILVALMVQYTVRIKWLTIVMWVNFAITVVATVYFGWHYLADDVAGIAIGVLSFWLGGVASGQKFDRRGLASHPTTTTSHIPVDGD